LSDQNDQRSVSASLSGVQKPDNVIFPLPSLIVLGTQRIPTISVSKSRPEPELQMSPKFGALLQFDQFATVGFSNVFQVATSQGQVWHLRWQLVSVPLI